MSNAGPQTSGRSLTVRQVALLLLLGVAVCAVFFALGFVVGQNQSGSAQGPVAEQVAPHSEIPPTVNPSAQESESQPPASATASTVSPLSSGVVEQDLKSGNPPLPPPTPPSGAQNGEQIKSPEARTEPPVSAASARPQRAAEPRGIMVQVVASRNAAHARALVRRLRQHGFHAVLIASRRRNIYRVQVGPFRSRQSAERAVRNLSREGFRPFIR